MAHRYAVIGRPIQQSKSPLIHSMFADAAGHAILYDAIEGRTEAFPADLDAFRAAGGRGMNVTAPFKLDAFAYATVRHARAEQAGAANCLRFEGDAVEADNFDGLGLLRDIEHNLGTPLAGRRVLMLGAGGAARGALAPLLAAEPAVLVVANRTESKAQALVAGTPAGACGVDSLAAAPAFDVVINATSAGLLGTPLDVPVGVFASGGVAYDMTYGKGLTGFLRSAAGRTARLHDGVGMLVEQAAEAFAWWRGIRPDTRAAIERITVPLQ